MAKIGLIQLDNTMEADVMLRQDAMLELTEKCLMEGADLVFFPECFQYAKKRECGDYPELIKEYSERLMKKSSELARKYKAYVVPWDYYVADDGKIYNSSYILDRNGEFFGRYCKCNLTHSELKTGHCCGTEIPVFDLDIGRIGIMICFDNYFPEVAAAIGNQGAKLILYPLYGDTLKPQWELKLIARAIDHSLYVASSQIDSKRRVSFTGIVDPEGNVISKLESDNTYCVVDIDLGKRVISNTSGSSRSKGEYLRDYLHKCRNEKAFASLTEKGDEPLEWEEIFL